MSYINAPKVCDCCSDPFGSVMYDAKTIQGPWANMCETCFKRFGVGLGIGRGQRYVLVDGKWEKTN